MVIYSSDCKIYLSELCPIKYGAGLVFEIYFNATHFPITKLQEVSFYMDWNRKNNRRRAHHTRQKKYRNIYDICYGNIYHENRDESL